MMHCSKYLQSLLLQTILVMGLCLSITSVIAEQSHAINNSVATSPNNSALGQPRQAFLAVEEAFQLDIQINETQLDLIWVIAPNYYLYRHAFELRYLDEAHPATSAEGLITDQLLLNSGLKTHDDYFGPVEVYYHQATASIKISSLMALTKQSELAKKGYLLIKYQGCAEAGLCYPVQSQQISLDNALSNRI
tara:strand:+ start:237 stop:812 length:576 start_codon:yes stop_codon:yes gene_type:complete